MDPLQILLLLASLAVALGGLVMLFRMSTRDDGAPRSPYVPFAVTFIGLMVAYRAFRDYRALQDIDLVIMFLFVFALLSLLGLQFFIVDRHKDHPKHDDTE
jgi:hypothetical protein